MNDIRRVVLWVVLVFSLILLWDKWQTYEGRLPTFFPSTETSSLSNKNDAGLQQAATSKSDSSASIPTAVQHSITANPLPTTIASTTSAVDLFTVTTDYLKLTFDLHGGTLIRSELLKYPDANNLKKNVTLFNVDANQYYVAQTGLIGGLGGSAYPNQDTLMTVTGSPTIPAGQSSMDLTFTSPTVGGVKWIKTYHIPRDSYVLNVSNSITNESNVQQTPQLYMQLVRDGSKPAGESSHYSTYTGPAIYTQIKHYQKVDFEDIKKSKAEYERQANNGYLAMTQHYFASAWLLPPGLLRNFSMSAVNVAPNIPDCCYRATMLTPVPVLAPGTTALIQTKLFVGPQEESLLSKLAPGLDLVRDYGILTVLAKPLFWLLSKLHGFLSNWGWSIVALVMLLKIAFYWLNARAYTSMARMRSIQPKVTELRARMKDNPKQMQVEMMKIYREEKVNPVGGCLPIIVQMPFFIALYWVLLSSVEMRDAPWILWINDLSRPDPYFILPILMTITSLFQVALNPQPPDPMQAKIMWIMPLVFSVMFAFFPAGLVLYWVTNNLLTIAQQWIINTRMGVPPKFNLPTFGKPKNK
jgi:YidC/Oxa1 family membrane protein insertase